MILYLIQMGEDGPVKIGITSDIKKRLTELQVGNPKRLRILKTFELKDDYAPSAEDSLHHSFRFTRMSGEWFKPTKFMMKVFESLYVDSEDGVLRSKMPYRNTWRDISDAYRSFLDVARKLREEGDFESILYVLMELDELKTDIKAGRH